VAHARGASPSDGVGDIGRPDDPGYLQAPTRSTGAALKAQLEPSEPQADEAISLLGAGFFATPSAARQAMTGCAYNSLKGGGP
jgi:hypothetical protein